MNSNSFYNTFLIDLTPFKYDKEKDKDINKQIIQKRKIISDSPCDSDNENNIYDEQPKLKFLKIKNHIDDQIKKKQINILNENNSKEVNRYNNDIKITNSKIDENTNIIINKIKEKDKEQNNINNITNPLSKNIKDRINIISNEKKDSIFPNNNTNNTLEVEKLDYLESLREKVKKDLAEHLEKSLKRWELEMSGRTDFTEEEKKILNTEFFKTAKSLETEDHLNYLNINTNINSYFNKNIHYNIDKNIIRNKNPVANLNELFSKAKNPKSNLIEKNLYSNNKEYKYNEEFNNKSESLNKSNITKPDFKTESELIDFFDIKKALNLNLEEKNEKINENKNKNNEKIKNKDKDHEKDNYNNNKDININDTNELNIHSSNSPIKDMNITQENIKIKSSDEVLINSISNFFQKKGKKKNEIDKKKRKYSKNKYNHLDINNTKTLFNEIKKFESIEKLEKIETNEIIDDFKKNDIEKILLFKNKSNISEETKEYIIDDDNNNNIEIKKINGNKNLVDFFKSSSNKNSLNSLNKKLEKNIELKDNIKDPLDLAYEKLMKNLDNEIRQRENYINVNINNNNINNDEENDNNKNKDLLNINQKINKEKDKDNSNKIENNINNNNNDEKNKPNNINIKIKNELNDTFKNLVNMELKTKITPSMSFEGSKQESLLYRLISPKNNNNNSENKQNLNLDNKDKIKDKEKKINSFEFYFDNIEGKDKNNKQTEDKSNINHFKEKLNNDNNYKDKDKEEDNNNNYIDKNINRLNQKRKKENYIILSSNKDKEKDFNFTNDNNNDKRDKESFNNSNNNINSNSYSNNKYNYIMNNLNLSLNEDDNNNNNYYSPFDCYNRNLNVNNNNNINYDIFNNKNFKKPIHIKTPIISIKPKTLNNHKDKNSNINMNTNMNNINKNHIEKGNKIENYTENENEETIFMKKIKNFNFSGINIQKTKELNINLFEEINFKKYFGIDLSTNSTSISIFNNNDYDKNKNNNENKKNNKDELNEIDMKEKDNQKLKMKVKENDLIDFHYNCLKDDKLKNNIFQDYRLRYKYLQEFPKFIKMKTCDYLFSIFNNEVSKINGRINEIDNYNYNDIDIEMNKNICEENTKENDLFDDCNIYSVELFIDKDKDYLKSNVNVHEKILFKKLYNQME
jgi:hypothetical protein